MKVLALSKQNDSYRNRSTLQSKADEVWETAVLDWGVAAGVSV